LCIDELVPTFEHLLDRAAGETVKIAITRAVETWLCRTDPHQLETAVLNLAINARDAMPDGGTLTLATGNLTIGKQAALRAGAAAGDYVVVSIGDDGTGMTPDVLAHVFEPFFTTKEIGKGTGLGLSQVYGFAKQSGGFVTIDSAPRHGTTVRIHLPRSREPKTGSAVVAGVTTLERGKGLVLLVEDDADVRATASAMLRDLGYGVREAATAQVALSIIDDGEAVDLVFSDVIMPDGMSGIELARELARRASAPRMLLTSGYTAQRIIPEELDGQLRLLRKPYTQPDLSLAIREAMRAPDA
ncbi:MAG: ATP-binding protein, partial [Burkholderiaceae bacterium]